MSISLITGPATEPVTLAEAKLHLRVDIADDDALITALIVAARIECENVLKRSLITQTWELVLDSFPSLYRPGPPYDYPATIFLPMPPAQSVTSVTYIDAAGAAQTLASNQYVLDKDSEPARLVSAAGVDWPATNPLYINAVRVRYVAGFGVAASAVPEVIKLWIKIRAATAYENREQIIAEPRVTVQEIPYVDSLLDRYRIVQVF